MSKTLKTGKHAVLTTMLMKNKDIDAMNRVGFVGAQDGTTSTTFNGADADQASIVVMDKMIKYAGHTYIQDNGTYQQDHDNSRNFGPGEAYSWEVKFPQAQTQGDLWIIDNHEVAYNVEYQQRVSIDPRYFCNEAARAVSCRKLSKGDIIQVSQEAFTLDTTANPPVYLVPDATKTVVEVDANGKLKAVQPGQATKEVFKVLGSEPMEFGYDRHPAWILEANSHVD